MILMVVAVGCGLGASYMTSKLLAERGNNQAEEPTKAVVVVKKRIAPWMPIKDPADVFEVKEYPERLAPKKALTSLDQVKDQRLKNLLEEGKPVTEDDLLSKEQLGLAGQMKQGQQAIAIKVTQETSVSGFILPGSRVNVIYITRNDGKARYILQNMLVLAIDTNDKRNPEQPTILGQTVTFAASAEETLRLSVAAATGEIRLTLKAPGDDSQIKNLVSSPADLDKPLRRRDQATTEEEEPKTVVAPPVPPLGPVTEDVKKEDAKKEDPKVVKTEEPKRPVRRKSNTHTMTIITGPDQRKVRYDLDRRDEDDEDSGDEPAPVRKPEPRKELKAEPRTQPKPEAKPEAKTEAKTDPNAGSAFGPKSTRSSRRR
jgi:pilus assembly protein CpaB